MKFRILVILFLHTILIFGFEYKVTVLSNEFDGDYDIFVSRIMPDGSNLIISSKLGGKTEDGSITITKDISSVRSRYSIALSSDITDECNIWIKDMFANDNSPYSKSISPCSVKVEKGSEEILVINMIKQDKGYHIETFLMGAKPQKKTIDSEFPMWKLFSIIPSNNQLNIHNSFYSKTRIITGIIWNELDGCPVVGADIFLNGNQVTKSGSDGSYQASYNYDKLDQKVYSIFADKKSREVTFNAFDEYPQAIDLKIKLNPPPPPKENYRKSYNVLFAFNSATLSDSERNKKLLDSIVKIISDSKIIGEIKIEGHTDSIGSQDYNSRLSFKRAEAVKNYISSKMDGLQYHLAGFGENQPLADNNLKEGREQNRRVEIAFEYIIE